MKIAGKISLSFLITGVILTFISVSIVFTVVKSSMQKGIFDHLETNVKSHAKHIEDFIEWQETLVELLANDLLLRNAIEAIIKGADTSLTDMAIAELEEAFEAEHFSNNFSELFVVDPDGRVILSTDKGNIGLDLSANIAFTEGKKETYVGDIYRHKKTEEESMDVATPILNADGSKIVGVFVGRVKGSSLYQLTLDRPGLGKTGEIYLVNKDHYLISPSRLKENVILQQKVDTENARECFQDMEKYASRPREVDHLTAKDREHFRIFEDYRGIAVMGTYSPIPKMQWALLAEIDAKEALAPLRFIKLIFILVLIVVPLVAWLVGVYVSRIVSGPIHKLHKGTEIIATGNLDYKIDIDSKDEIGQLSRAFDKMTEDLRETTTSVDELNKEITNRKQAEEALRTSEEKLARSQKMESLGLLAGGVAHDLNNVLSGIVGYPELLLLDLPEDSPLRKPIETIQETGHKAAAIVQDLITVVRGVAMAKEPLNLNAIVEGYLLSPEFNKLEQFHSTVTVKTNLDTDLLNINGSDAHLRKVVMNLVSNASEAIEGSGNVTISTMTRYVDRPLRGYEDVIVGEYVVLSVSDDGPGISPDDIERIFEPFYTKKVMGRSGTGLGLAVVWNIVQDLKGYIDVISDKNGTTFELYFSITRDEVSDKDLSIPINDYKGDGETILVVDDMESQRYIACKMLETLGYKANAVSSGEEAVEYLTEHTVDLLLLDMIMDPSINGRETYERIIKIHPNQKAIIASGFAETDDVKTAQELGAGQYIKKPYTLERIGIAVRGELKK